MQYPTHDANAPTVLRPPLRHRIFEKPSLCIHITSGVLGVIKYRFITGQHAQCVMCEGLKWSQYSADQRGGLEVG